MAVSLSVLLVTLGLSAQNLTVTGTVVDEQDLPLTGASIIVAGTNTGEITDLDGKFSIKVKKGTKLVISYIGYKEQELVALGQNNVTIKLQPDNQLLDEIVVVGYGAVKRSDLTGSVASITSEAIEGYQTSSVIGALSGQIAGVQITQSDGTPGSGFSVNIRGVGTLSGDNSPLYIVDGFQVDNIDFLSEADIESIEVLKDASSSAIYGSRAANGVVMVTTKSGKTGRPVVTYNGSATYRIIPKELPVLDAYEFVKIQGEINSSYTGAYYKPNTATETFLYNSVEDYRNVETVDWQALTFRPTWSQDHNVTVTGGTDQTKYSMLFSHYDEDGIFINSGFTKTNAKVRFTQKLWKNVTFDGTINYARTNKRGAGTTADAGRFNTLAQIISARPTGGLKMTNEELINSPIDLEMLEGGESLAQVNPIHQNQNVTNTKKADQWSGNVALTWEIVKGLTFKTAATYNTTFIRNDIFYKNGSKEAYRNGESPYGSSQTTKQLRWVNYNQLTWKQKIGKHSYDIMIGEEASQMRQEYVYAQAMDFPFDNFGNDNLALGATPSSVKSFAGSNSLLSFFARANYNFNDRYLITGTIRADGSTVFSEKNKWGFFPSFSAAWRINKEKFMKNARHISNLKLRAGWGTVGNDRIANFLSLDLYTPYKYGIGSDIVTVMTPKQLQNSDLKWEGSSTVNVGMDFGFFKDRLTFTIDLFNKDTKDLLQKSVKIPSTAGYASLAYQNVGSMTNDGWEINVNAKKFLKIGKFSMSAGLNLAQNYNEITEMDDRVLAAINSEWNATNRGTSKSSYSFQNRVQVGNPLGSIYGFRYKGVYQYTYDYLTNLSTEKGWTTDEFEANINAMLAEGKTFPVVVGADGKVIMQSNGLPQRMVYNYTADNGATYSFQGGDAIYEDINHDGQINGLDVVYLGNCMPKISGGFNFTFNYGQWNLKARFMFRAGNKVINLARMNLEAMSTAYNQCSTVNYRWRKDGDNTMIPRAIFVYDSNSAYNYQGSDRFVEDGSFLRFQNLQVGYTFPKKQLKQWGLTQLQVYMTMNNLFCWTKYSGVDPEISTSGWGLAIDASQTPRSKSFTANINIGF